MFTYWQEGAHLAGLTAVVLWGWGEFDTGD